MLNNVFCIGEGKIIKLLYMHIKLMKLKHFKNYQVKNKQKDIQFNMKHIRNRWKMYINISG